MIAVAVAVLVVGGSAIAWWAGGPPGRPTYWATPVRLLVLGALILDGLGAVALAASGESTGGALLIGASFVAIGLGASAVRLVTGGATLPMTEMTVGPVRAVVVAGLAGVGLAMYGLLASRHGIPLLTGDAQSARAGFVGPPWDLFRWLVPPAALVAAGIALTLGSRRWAIAGLGAIGGVIALEVLAASRALPFELGVTALLLVVWAGRRLRLGVWALVVTAAAVIFLGVLFARVAPEGSFSGPLDAVAFALNRTVGRVILIQPRTVDAAVDVFPDQLPHLGGSSYLRWTSRLTGEEPPAALGTILFAHLFPGEPPGGFAAPGLLAEGYANFGPIFALGLMVVVGGAAAGLGRWLGHAPADVATRVLAALLAVAIMRTYATSLNGFLITCGAALGWWILVAGPWPRPWRGLRGSDPG